MNLSNRAEPTSTPTLELQCVKACPSSLVSNTKKLHKNPGKNSHKNPRNIPRSIRYQVWRRDQGQCTKCGGKRNLNFDHIKPIALGGDSSVENLRLMCFHCNQRQAIKTFGMDKMSKFQTMTASKICNQTITPKSHTAS